MSAIPPSVAAALLKIAGKLAKALFKKQYEVSKEKEDAKVNTDKSDKPAHRGL